MLTQLFIIRHSARITECTLHNNGGGKESWNIEEKKVESAGLYTLVIIQADDSSSSVVFESNVVFLVMIVMVSSIVQVMMVHSYRVQ